MNRRRHTFHLLGIVPNQFQWIGQSPFFFRAASVPLLLGLRRARGWKTQFSSWDNFFAGDSKATQSSVSESRSVDLGGSGAKWISPGSCRNANGCAAIIDVHCNSSVLSDELCKRFSGKQTTHVSQIRQNFGKSKKSRKVSKRS